MVKRLLKTFMAVLAIAASATGPARAQIYGNNIDLSNGESGTLSSGMTCTYFTVVNQGTLTVNQGVTLTLNCEEFDLKTNSAIHLHGTMTGSVGDDADWNNNSYINVYLSDGAKYTVTGLECNDGDGYLRYYGYDAATDGHGTVSVTNGSTAVTASSIGYSSTTYTFTATPASGYHFVNWTKGAGGEELGTDASIDVTCEQNGQYQVYANFEEDVPAGPAWGQNSNVSWVLTPYGDLQNGDTVVIVDKTYERAMSNNNGSFSAPSAVEIGLSGDQNALSAAPAATLQWVVERDNGNYMFKVPGTSNYLYCTSDNDGVRVGSGNKSFEFQDGGTYNVPFLKNNATSRYLGLTNAYLWRCPSSISGSSIKDNVISFYKKTVIIIPPHTVTFADGTEDVGNWTVTPAEALTTGVIAGTTLTATYAGDLKVKEVIAAKHQEPTPLTIEALTAGNVVVQNPESGMQYTLNGGAKTAMTEASTVITVAVGDKVAFYGDGTNITSYNFTRIGGGYDGTAEVKVYGNIMSLVNETGFDTATTLTANNAFHSLFEGYFNLKDISGLKLPATTLTEGCYDGMFSYCTGLTTVPSDLLPATTLAENCYAGMFGGCDNLTNVPTLPATTLAMGCYNNMFSFCTGLITVPTDLLPATTLDIECYSHMFHFCPNLTTAPVLPATTLVESCYIEMFSSCYKLSSVTCLATSGINQNNSTEFWLDRAGSAVQGTKTFNAVSTAEWPTDDSEGIPIGWTRQNIDN